MQQSNNTDRTQSLLASMQVNPTQRNLSRGSNGQAVQTTVVYPRLQMPQVHGQGINAAKKSNIEYIPISTVSYAS